MLLFSSLFSLALPNLLSFFFILRLTILLTVSHRTCVKILGNFNTPASKYATGGLYVCFARNGAVIFRSENHRLTRRPQNTRANRLFARQSPIYRLLSKMLEEKSSDRWRRKMQRAIDTVAVAATARWLSSRVDRSIGANNERISTPVPQVVYYSFADFWHRFVITRVVPILASVTYSLDQFNHNNNSS